MPPKSQISVRSVRPATIKVELLRDPRVTTAKWVNAASVVHVISAGEKVIKIQPGGLVDLRSINKALRGKRDVPAVMTAGSGALESA
jgi:hypothetical protein